MIWCPDRHESPSLAPPYMVGHPTQPVDTAVLVSAYLVALQWVAVCSHHHSTSRHSQPAKGQAAGERTSGPVNHIG